MAQGNFLGNLLLKGQREKKLWDNSSLSKGTEAGEHFCSKQKVLYMKERNGKDLEEFDSIIITMGFDYHIKSV